MRDWINNNSLAITVASIALLVVCLVIVFTRGSTAVQTIDGPPGAYFFDLGAQVANPLDALFVQPANEIPPIKAPSGGQGVKAYVFACGDCSDKSRRFIGYLETYTPQAKETLNKLHHSIPNDPSAAGPMVDLGEVESFEQGHLIAPMDDYNYWVPFNSEEAVDIIQKAQRRCKSGQVLNTCMPGQVAP